MVLRYNNHGLYKCDFQRKEMLEAHYVLTTALPPKQPVIRIGIGIKLSNLISKKQKLSWVHIYPVTQTNLNFALSTASLFKASYQKDTTGTNCVKVEYVPLSHFCDCVTMLCVLERK